MIELRGVHKSFGERTVLDGLDLSLPGGRFYALLGRSGSGKSTLLHLLAGLDTPDQGDVRVGGQCVSAMTATQSTVFRQHQVGFVFQFFHLLPTLTVAQNLQLPLELKGSTGDVGKMLARVGLADRARSYPDLLSGGEQQRVAVGRALIHDPDLILADEPTGNLDDETGMQILSLLVEMVRERGKTLLMVTHNSQAAALADQVLTLRGGKIALTAGGQ